MTTYNLSAVPTSGVLCCRGELVLGWPEEAEFDKITSLRNSSNVRQWFLDDRPLDIAANRSWLNRGMRRPEEALLSIRHSSNNLFLGTIGWSKWIPDCATADFGRLALDRNALTHAISNSKVTKSVALDATIALRDFAFEVMQIECCTTSYIKGNTLAARVNARVGMVINRHTTTRRPNGQEVELVELSLDRDRWLSLR